ncbi:hypothetical protein [Enterococcus ureasiticus]|uniref:Uncharacterized protein n=1 Tax=Enterococcus ureasiticus TaxID=903984 RepID=A0A1E5GIF8_9ENTE|nr:hypothetical protein [Enterococcus ureasiticus]OEG12030.1 hypothetical protein BCR21_07275 [Enterococcus ureasiticus]
MEYKEMANSLSYGEEYNFYYNGEEYWMSRNDDGNYLTTVSSEETQEFKTATDLLEKARIGDKTILNIWEEIKDQF